ncbi:MAG: endolytic transglycosylase MltG [Steroidobacteraceae bacterium]|nr:endolytic transglycosylase MltG [Nevskiaceae bacterium]MCP5339160.1 endolytic transglycosylase MltG [Nevskiaceae bacterium]MCP5360468.1 endolytic transglycosylase MltG [Nevskiaceae bacterium]MCP5466999.1 endolytic transglycosylase MltG [Nevskiaceae bacterium]
MSKRALPIVLLVLLLVAAGALLVWRSLEDSVNRPGPHAETVRIHVRPGEGLRTVLGGVARQGALHDARAVELWLRLRGRNPKVRAGTYDLPAGSSALEILARLERGEVVLESLTIVEGVTFRDFRRALEAHPRVRTTLRERTDAEIMTALGRPGLHPEGWFFPDTYRFADGTTDLEILRLASRQMERELAAAWEARRPDLPIHSPYEALILASIVEKETALPAERPLVAGVYTTRLRRGMRLQSDPTVIYGIGESYDGDIRGRDLRTDTPYNTYVRNGLPPTPIALPGRDALRAVAAPRETGAIFFVATGLPDGSHFFSATYEEHRQGVTRMLERQRARDREARRAGAGAAGATGARP